MLARAHRFHGHSSLRYVYTRGQTVRGVYGILKYAPNPKRTHWRAAVVVSRKVHKSAVVRNRIRRRIYEIFRTTIPADGPPIDLVFIVHGTQAAEDEVKKLQKAVCAQLTKANIVSPPHAIVDKKEQ